MEPLTWFSLEGLIYAGFWIRVMAKLIDCLILGALEALMFLSDNPIMASTRSDTISLIQFTFTVGLCYSTLFLGSFAATPGKMACGLKVVTADKGKEISVSICVHLWLKKP